MNGYRSYGLILLFTGSLLLTACSGSRKLQQYQGNNICNQSKISYNSFDSIPAPIHELVLDSSLVSRFGAGSLNVANAIGVLDLLTEYVRHLKDYSRQPGIEKKLHKLDLAQKISQRINLASLEVSALSAELDCEEKKITQIADYLSNKESEAETRLTVTAIVVGAAGAVASGLLLSNGYGGDNLEYVGIAAGITEATLGLLVLTSKKRIEFQHQRNALREIWEGHEKSEIFPPPVWYYLNYYNPDEPDIPSIRYQIIERWMSFKQIDDAGSRKKRKLIDLYFGEGGSYTTEQLYNRANMFDQLDSYIKLIKQDLMSLSIEFESLK